MVSDVIHQTAEEGGRETCVRVSGGEGLKERNIASCGVVAGNRPGDFRRGREW